MVLPYVKQPVKADIIDRTTWLTFSQRASLMWMASDHKRWSALTMSISLSSASPTSSPCGQTDSTNASPLPLFSMIHCYTRWGCFLFSPNDFRACRQPALSCLSPSASSLAKSREAIDSGLWRVGRDEGILRQHTYIKSHAHTNSHLDHRLLLPLAIAG